jgi:S1-C subfamily serine protease
VLAGASGRVAAEPSPAKDLETLSASVAPAVVSLKGTLEAQATFGGVTHSGRIEGQAHGTIVDPTGLVLVSDSSMGGAGSPRVAAVLRRLPGLEIQTEVVDLRVILGADQETLPAVLVVRDARNDLAWVQILDLGDRRLPVVDVAAGHDPRVGEPLLAFGRLGRGFGYAPFHVRGHVGSAAQRPRRTWAITVDESLVGLVHFDAVGVPIGVLSYLAPPEGAEEDDADLRLLPLDVVRRSLEAARKHVPEALEKARPATPDEGR